MASDLNFAFMHGGGQGAWVWSETIDAIHRQAKRPDIQTIGFDLPGSGAKRDQDPTELTTKDAAEVFISDLESSGLSDIILVGHSAAGTILPFVAQARPDLVRRYVYVSCIAPAPGQSVAELMGSGRHGGDDASVGWPDDEGAAADTMKRLSLMFCNDMNDAETAGFMARLGQDRWPNLLALEDKDWRYDQLENKPSTYVLCLRDHALPLPWQEQFAERLRAQEIVRLDAGHQAMNTRPQALAEILLNEAAR